MGISRRTRPAIGAAVVCALLLSLPVGPRAGAGEETSRALRAVPRDSLLESRFAVGADVSFLQEIENRGGTFREGGVRRDLLDILWDHGFNYARLRIWHSPRDGYCGLDSTLVMAERIKAKGMGLFLDFHYSDTWADPGRQSKPAAWEGIPFESLEDSVYAYTRFVVGSLKARGALPDMVGLGNEITCGMLWDDGKVCGPLNTPAQWDNLADLIRRARRGLRDALGEGDSVEVVIQIDRGADVRGSIAFFDSLLARGVAFDVIGLSYYPWWHGTLEEVETNLDSLARRYGKNIIIAETAYPWTLGWHDGTHNIVGLAEQTLPGYPATVAGQEAFLAGLADIVYRVPGSRGRGIFYWAPDYIAVPGMGSPWENLTLFDFEGGVLPSASAFEAALRREDPEWPSRR